MCVVFLFFNCVMCQSCLEAPPLWLCCHLLGNAELLANTFSMIIRTVFDVKYFSFIPYCEKKCQMSAGYRLFTVLQFQLKSLKHTYIKNAFNQKMIVHDVNHYSCCSIV